MNDVDPRQLVSRHVAVWNQPDAELRRKAIRDLWAEDGAHILSRPGRSATPPQGWALPLPPSKPAGTMRSKCG